VTLSPERIARFWSLVNKTDGCWEWTASRKDGDWYGAFHIGGRRVERTHRVSWVLCHGPIPSGKSVLHTCDNSICVRPDHLYLGTQLDNVRDRVQRGRSNSAVGERQWAAKLTPAQVIMIRALSSEMELTREYLSRMYGVTPSHIGKIRRGNMWRHLS
jgi:hypothetical protein